MPGPPDSRSAQDDARWSAWMAQAHAGDADAYRKLLAELSEVIEGWLRRRFGSADFVEDCAQECLLSIHRARASYDPDRSFRAWMFAIVRHKTIDLLRRRGARERRELADPSAHETEPAACADPGAARDTAGLLRTLEPPYRDAIVWTRLEGRTIAEAAARAGVSESAIKSRVSRGLRQLRARLVQEPDP